ncbi:hypothetical protein E2C01_099830 [Portunus trituberculatus]|uniref:Uncharacterized protein n=1 Tax=Portunus trituberculatus TaxID=210409 RepID=A0A5B7KBY0_PORTR|nr:hypothetical protein [Portunus trituberculatus]
MFVCLFIFRFYLSGFNFHFCVFKEGGRGKREGGAGEGKGEEGRGGGGGSSRLASPREWLRLRSNCGGLVMTPREAVVSDLMAWLILMMLNSWMTGGEARRGRQGLTSTSPPPAGKEGRFDLNVQGLFCWRRVECGVKEGQPAEECFQVVSEASVSPMTGYREFHRTERRVKGKRPSLPPCKVMYVNSYRK